MQNKDEIWLCPRIQNGKTSYKSYREQHGYDSFHVIASMPVIKLLTEIADTLDDLKEGLVPGVDMPCKYGPRGVMNIVDDLANKIRDFRNGHGT